MTLSIFNSIITIIVIYDNNDHIIGILIILHMKKYYKIWLCYIIIIMLQLVSNYKYITIYILNYCYIIYKLISYNILHIKIL